MHGSQRDVKKGDENGEIKERETEGGEGAAAYMYMRINNETTCCAGFTGIDSSYEPPENPDLVLKASEYTVQECVDKLVGFLQERVWLCCL